MSRPLPYLVHGRAEGEPLAAFAHAEDAAQFVAALGDGAQVTYFGAVVWHEGHEDSSAGESYDDAADVMHARTRARDEAVVSKIRGAA